MILAEDQVVKTRDLQFFGTKFTDNYGHQVAAGSQKRTEGILFKGPGCEIAAGREAGALNTSREAIRVQVPSVEIDNCDHCCPVN